VGARNEKRIGIIGGSGLYDIDIIQNVRQTSVYTPFGEPSDAFDIGELEGGKEIVFLPRHGKGHKLMPSEINHRANMWAMKKLGVEWIISVSAVGSFKKEIRPLDIVLVDQFFDRTKQSAKHTFFGDGLVAHVMFAQPICSDLRRILFEAGQEEGEGKRIHWGGTYLNMEGPAFSTIAESLLYKSWGIDVIGMTNLAEAKLAREAEICYASLAMVTDYDSWIDGDTKTIVNVDMVLKNLKATVDVAKKIIGRAILQIPEERNCDCVTALQNAIVTAPEVIPKETIQKLEPIVGKYLK